MLFICGGVGGVVVVFVDVIMFVYLRCVVVVLKEDVDEELLKDMILEVNGG